jgi:hypothetical protein
VTRPVGYQEYSQEKEQPQSRTLITSPSPLTSRFKMLSEARSEIQGESGHLKGKRSEEGSMKEKQWKERIIFSRDAYY